MHRHKKIKRDIYWKILRHQLIVTGTWNSSYYGAAADDCDMDDWHYVMKRLNSGAISPAAFITHRYEMTDLDKGFHIMRDKTEDYVKIMMINACV